MEEKAMAERAHLVIRPETAKRINKVKAKEKKRRPYNVTTDIIVNEALDAYLQKA